MHLRRIIPALVLAAITVAALASPASAKPTTTAWGGCSSGNFCAYEHENGNGRVWAWFGDDSNYTNDVVSGMAANDNASSVWNNGLADVYDDVRFYQHINYTGNNVCLARGFAIYNLGAIGWNDTISSHHWAQSC